MNIVWKDILGFPDYQVSNCGEIYSKKSNKILKRKYDRYGYVLHNLYKNNKCITVVLSTIFVKMFFPEYDKNVHIIKYKNNVLSDIFIGNISLKKK